MEQTVRTGCFIDEFDGLYPGTWHLFYGPDGSGKTLGCLVIALSFLSQYPDRHALFIEAETPSAHGTRVMAGKLADRLGFKDSLSRLVFVDGFSSIAQLHDFFLDRNKEKSLSGLFKKFDVGMFIIDSLTKFYAKELGRAIPKMRPVIASEYGAKYFHTWYDHLSEVMLMTEPFPVLATAWLKSNRIAQLLSKTTEKEADEMFSEEESDREFVGGKHIAHLCKVRYRVMRREFVIIYTQTRGPYMGKSVQFSLI
ncbi:MAG: hypothetical protein QXP38_11565 [Nitrososphaerota archaeon]